MASDELCWLSATDLATLIRRRKVSPVEVVDAVLERIERLNPQLNAYVTVTVDGVPTRVVAGLSPTTVLSCCSRSGVN